MNEEEIFVLTSYRLEQAVSSLDDARFLLQGKRTPRSIINRAYYAVFYATLALLQQISHVPRKHSGAISIFDKEFVLKGIFPKKLSRDIHHLFNLRQASDYQVLEPLTMEEAQDAIQKAENFVKTIREYLFKKRQTRASNPHGK